MGTVFRTCFSQLSSREKPSSSINIDEAVGLFSSLIDDLQKLENSISLQWCVGAMNLLKKLHSQFLLFLEKIKVPILWDGVNCLDEYMKETLNLLDLCNLLRSAIFRMDRYRIMVDIAVGKLHDDESSQDATRKTELERLEKESKNLYGVENWKDVSLYKDGMPKTKSKDSTIHVIYAIKSAMTVIALLILSAILYPFPIKMEAEEVSCEFPQLKSFLSSLQKLVCCFLEKDISRPVLVENKMIERTVADMKNTAADKEKLLKNIDLLKKGSVALKEGLEMFESLVNELFDDVLKGRNKALGMVTATRLRG